MTKRFKRHKDFKRKRMRKTLKAKTRFAGEVATGRRPGQKRTKMLYKSQPYADRRAAGQQTEPPGMVKIPLDEIKEKMGEDND